MAVVICFLSMSSKQVLAKEFKDVNASNSAASAIQWGVSAGIVGGFEDGTFRPNTLLTEGQFAAMLTRYYAEITTEASAFKELDGKVWSNSSYEALARFQVPFMGYTDRAYRNKPITRGLVAQVISYVNGQTSELEGAVQYLFDEKLTVGQHAEAVSLVEKYGYKNNITRAQAVAFFHRLNGLGKIELAGTVIDKKSSAAIGSLEAEELKKQSIRKVNPQVKPVQPPATSNYIEGQRLPTKPTYLKGILVVNKVYPLPETYAPGESKVARNAFEEMRKEAKKSAINLTAFSTYRSFPYQKNIYTKYVKKDGKVAADRYSARPGYSEHQTGLAFDIGEVGQAENWASHRFDDTKASKWLAANAHTHGFIQRFPKGKEPITGYIHESWHYRYVGKEISTEIFKRKITLEEFVK
jgi:LAS superfamily LD-carboxypeptidase LdcB